MILKPKNGPIVLVVHFLPTYYIIHKVIIMTIIVRLQRVVQFTLGVSFFNLVCIS